MSLRSLKTLAIAATPLFFLLSYSPASIAAEGTSTTKVYRPKNVKPKNVKAENVKTKTQAATGVAIVNAASYLPGICPGGIASIFGVGLSVVTDVESATTDPLPLQIADVTVFVNGVPAPLYTVAFTDNEDQINFQVPYETPVGLAADNQGVTVDVYSNNVLVSSTIVDSFTEDPGIFIYDQNNIEFAIAVHVSDFSLITTTNPASAGEYVVLYTTGLGPLTISIPDGQGAPSDTLAYTADPFTASIDGQSCGVPPVPASACSVLFSGLAPGFVGLYQLNLQMPNSTFSGPNVPVQIFTSYSNSGIAYLPVN